MPPVASPVCGKVWRHVHQPLWLHQLLRVVLPHARAAAGGAAAAGAAPPPAAAVHGHVGCCCLCGGAARGPWPRSVLLDDLRFCLMLFILLKQ